MRAVLAITDMPVVRDCSPIIVSAAVKLTG
jgi:hypothetical protein